jgi:RNA polymerase sigma factor (sigma-70 family)
MIVTPELIRKCTKGDRRSQNELYRITYPYLMSICLRYTHNSDRARENLNIGFFKILRYLGSYRIAEPFKPWVRKVMINSLIREYKKEKALTLNLVYVQDYLDSAKYTELNEIIGQINTQQMYEYVARLHPTARQVFNLFIVDGYQHKEIAAMLDISEGTSKWYLNQAREKLRDMINEGNSITDSQHPNAIRTHE